MKSVCDMCGSPDKVAYDGKLMLCAGCRNMLYGVYGDEQDGD